ncbi:MAG: hypothetical protein JWM67_1854 [Mycobacterium sp.]|jgi:hypothetical protein|nr:hypothetical protein [Mycobacterium sp.]
MKGWKWVGLAGLAGVTATGVAVARAERRRAAYTPEQVRERLHARLAETGEADPGTDASVAATHLRPADRWRAWREHVAGRGREGNHGAENR